MGLKVLLIGFGNPGRLDDGLGPELASSIEKLKIPDVTVDSNYQLTVEDAAEVAKHDVVIFADASVNAPEPFSFKKIQDARPNINFSTHSVEPESVLGMARELFKAKTEGYILAIRGYEFNEFGEGLSERARDNLKKAVKFMEFTLSKQDFIETEG